MVFGVVVCRLRFSGHILRWIFLRAPFCHLGYLCLCYQCIKALAPAVCSPLNGLAMWQMWYASQLLHSYSGISCFLKTKMLDPPLTPKTNTAAVLAFISKLIAFGVAIVLLIEDQASYERVTFMHSSIV